jgi:hypothetical protein
MNFFRYFICFRGTPLPRTCADNLWWDVEKNWCTVGNNVTCDSRTVNNPNNPSTTTTTDAIVTIPTDPPNLSDCFRISHLFNPETGDYMKSTCVINRSINYEQAMQTCQENNMNLFIISNSIEQSAFFTATTNDLILQRNGFIWINGRRENNGEWFTSPNSNPLYSAINWVQTETIDGRTSGDCLRYSQQHGPYEAMGVDCNANSWATCEFHSQPTLNTEICWQEIPLMDDEGNYLKTSCFINTRASHWMAEQICLNNGMNLFVINNSTVQSAFFKVTTSTLVGFPRGVVWINGKRDNFNEWHSHNPMKAPIYQNIEWVNTAEIDGRAVGDCLSYSQQHGPYQALGEECNAQWWFTCEY